MMLQDNFGTPLLTEPVHSPNSTCRHFGHQWQRTAGRNYRRCTREKCRAVERLVGDTWVDATAKRRTRKTTPKTPYTQTDFWSSGDDEHRFQKAAEREAELRYLRLLGR